MQINGIAIVGGNGSGKTTLCKELANSLKYKAMDIEDYYFPNKNDYLHARSKEEVKRLLLEDILKYPQFIFSSINGDYSLDITTRYDLVIYLQVPLSIRLDRVKKRSYKQFGDRMMPNGDLYDHEQAFFNKVSQKNLDTIDTWLNSLSCPVLYLDGTKSIKENIKIILNKIDKIK